MKAVLLTLSIGALAVGVPLSAHHSFAADYFEDRTVTVTGDLVEFEYRSPHAWVQLLVRDANGEPQKYSAEWASAPRLQRSGIAADTLKPGDRLTITGAPGRNAGERRLHVKTIERPADGWVWRGAGQRR
ncbi:MAG: DUF6152 family protein [Acidobacteriota bacterium]